MTIFNEYASYYDMLYKDKDYRGEADYIHSLIQNLAPGTVTVLNLGCGSGKHDGILSERGYKVTGVDLSQEMLAAAEAATDSDSIDYVHGDVRSVRLKQTFDVVISLFHVMSYQITNADLAATFETARCHLKPGGVLIFDCWYGPGVLSDPPTVRIKEVEDDSVNVIRIAEPVLHVNENVVDVNYRIIVIEKSSGIARILKEAHRMRYLFVPELKDFLNHSTLQPEFFCKWLETSLPNEATWYLCCAARYTP